MVRWIRERLHTRWLPWACIGLTGVFGVAFSLLVVAATWLDYQNAPPPCYGIGWGCSLDPGTTGKMVAFGWFFALGCVALLLAVTELFWQRVAVARSVIAVVVAGLAAAGVLLVVAATLLAAVG